MRVLDHQSKFNATSRSQWNFYESHRNHISAMVSSIRKKITCPKPTIAILGAGNGNDLNLEFLAKQFPEIHLFDCDSQALAYLKEQQMRKPPASSAAVIEPLVDLTGIAKELDQLPDPITEPFVLQLGEKARQVEFVLPNQQFDVVLSTCLMTQLMSSIVASFGDGGQFKDYMMIAVRDGHLNLMSRLMRPGGIGLLVNDFVSSDTLPELNAAETGEAVLSLARKAIDERNFFSGTNPWAVTDSLKKILVEAPSKPWTIAPPWRWQIGNKRSYLVTAIEFSK